ncbi:MAG: amino acid permease [Candidatus Gastranaerophilales bacterium]|nr:amino acid permease [Candidatus Gastranaerophilales bacterium]
MSKEGQLNFYQRIFRKKNIDKITEESSKSSLKKSLNAVDLIILGVGAVIGTGIFTVSGVAIAGNAQAGPSFMISLIIAAFACVFAALSYAEFSSMIPVAGSAYTYTFVTFGEMIAWTVGWVLMLEYAIGNIAVAISWTSYFFNFLQGFGHILPTWLITESNWVYNVKLFDIIPLYINIPTLLIIAAVTILLYKGIEESKKMTSIMVFIKLSVIALFLIVGSSYVQPENWTPFVPNGFNGIFQSAFLIFFAYIGFDAVSTAAEETKNPQKNVPLGIIGTLAICALIYIAIAAVLTGIMPWQQVDLNSPLAAGMTAIGQGWAAKYIALGAVAGLASVLLVLQLGTTRILYAMSRDNLLPGVFSKIHPKFKTPHVITIASGVFVGISTMFFNLEDSANLCNIGTFAAFIIVSLGVIILRYKDPDRHRPFRVPLSPFIPILGIIVICGIIYLGIPAKTFIAFIIWLIAGLVIYFSYGYKKTYRVYLQEQKAEKLTVKENKF